MFLLLLLGLSLVIATRTCEAAALGVSGPEGEAGVAAEDLTVIRELEELNEKIRMAAKSSNKHQSQARVVPPESVQEEEQFDREDHEVFNNATEIPSVETTASSSSVIVDESATADNELTSPSLTSPPPGTTSADSTLLQAISTVLSTVMSNTTSVPASSSFAEPSTSNSTFVPPVSNTSTVPAQAELGNAIGNAQPSTGQDNENNIINPVLPEELNRPGLPVGHFKAYFSNVVAPEVEDHLHSFQPQRDPPHLQSTYVPEQPSGGDFLCPDRYYRLGRTCFRPSEQRLSFFGATQDCRAENGDLAVIKDPPTHRFLIELIQTYNPSAEEHWIGLSDLLRERTFVWSDGIPLEGTTFWAHGQPNNLGGDQHCVYMCSLYDYEWVDRNCSDQLYYICEQPAINSLDQILFSHLYNIGIGAVGESPDVVQPTPAD
ncbi:uncharacterized protein LOC144872121 [Branchiostoma floridae x Branchiostoma japonicum]